MNDAGWSKLHDGETYKIYDEGVTFWGWLLRDSRYTVTAPSGRVLGVSSTRRGALRLIRKDKRQRKPESHWWDSPIVGEVPRG